MKRNLFALALVLFVGNVLFASAQVSPAQAPATGSASPVVSEYGTLLDVLNGDGSSRFDKLALDGFQLNYKFKSQVKKVQAIGATAGEGLRPGQVNIEGNSTTVTVKTEDGALEITNRFKLNRQNELIIHRTIRNISSEKVSLITTRQYLDPKLVGATCADRRASLNKAASRQVTALACSACPLFERPPHDPPCLTVVCLNNLRDLAFLATPDATQSIGDCSGITLEWKRPKNLAPSGRERSGNEVQEMHFVWGLPLQER